MLLGAILLTSCGRLEKAVVPQQVYVTAKQAYLRDRVAAVSNRTGEVANGDKLTVLGHQRRFLQVRAPNGAVGWIEEKLTADQGVADQFAALTTEHEKDPVIVQAVTRDEVYLHLQPGRDTMHFFRLPENETAEFAGAGECAEGGRGRVSGGDRRQALSGKVAGAGQWGLPGGPRQLQRRRPTRPGN